MPRRTTAAVALALSSLLLSGCGEAARGLAAYREGRFADAQAAFSAAVEAAGEEASAELHYNRGLAALRAGDHRTAEACAEKAAARGEGEIAALADFLAGNAVFAACEVAARQASTPAAEPFAFDVAIAYAGKAAGFWQRAAMSRLDWPEARRNVERALLKAEELKRKKSQREEERRRAPTPQPKPRPPAPQPAPQGEKRPEEKEAVPQLGQLPPEEVMRLLERLAEKEREKTALRRAQRRERMAGAGRDW